jgi:hypothetical protein
LKPGRGGLRTVEVRLDLLGEHSDPFGLGLEPAPGTLDGPPERDSTQYGVGEAADHTGHENGERYPERHDRVLGYVPRRGVEQSGSSPGS